MNKLKIVVKMASDVVAWILIGIWCCIFVSGTCLIVTVALIGIVCGPILICLFVVCLQSCKWGTIFGCVKFNEWCDEKFDDV